MRNPFKRKALSATPSAVDAVRTGGGMPFPMLGGGARDRILAIYNRAQGASYGWMYAKSPAVRTVVDVIVRNVGQLDLRLYEEVSEGDRRARPEHPAALSLRYPNETTTSDGLIRSLYQDYLVHDNAYALILPAPGDQLQIMRLPAFMVEVQGSSIFSVENYRVWPQGAWTTAGSWGGAGTPMDFGPDRILHWHGENPLDPRIGLSRLDTLRDVCAEDAALQQATVELANSGLMEPAWVFRPNEAPQWSNAARAAFEEDLMNRMRQRNEKPLVLEEGMEMRSFAISPRDAQMYEIRRWALERVSALYGVPLGMVGLDANVDQARSEFLSDTLPPYCEDFTRMLNQRVLVRVYDWTDGCFEFNLDEKRMGDDRLKALVSASGRAVLLTNEARAMVNKPPVDGGDELVTPLNVIVGDNPKPSPQVMPPQQPGGPPQDGSHRIEDAPAQQQPQPSPKARIKRAEPIAQLHPRYAGDIQRQRLNAHRFQGTVQRHLMRLHRSLKSNPDTDWGRWDRELARDLERPLREVIGAEGRAYALKLGGQGFDVGQTHNYRLAMAQGAASGLNTTVRRQISDLGLGDAMARIPQHISSAGTSLGANATIWAREEAARQAPGYERRIKSWISDSDRHAEWDGVTVGIEDDWPAGFAPGQAPGCGCSVSIA